MPTKTTSYSEYKPWLTFWKFLQVFLMGGFGALIASVGGFPPTETVLVTIAILKAIQNYVKHC